MIIYIFLNISYNLFSNKHMKWTEPHDIYFLREMMLCQPWEHKKGSTEREETWARLAANLIKCSKLVFYVTQRSPRDRYLLLERKHKKKVFDEENSSGISPEDTEIDQLMNEIVDLLDEKLNLPQICLVQICASKEERLRITNDVNNENVLYYYNNNDVQQTYSREPEVL